jgi:hypothetical protein
VEIISWIFRGDHFLVKTP